MPLDFSELKNINNAMPQRVHTIISEEQQRYNNMLEVYREHNKNRIASGQLIADIAKGAKQSENPVELLLKALKAISLMTDNKLTYDIIKTDIEKNYKSD